MHTPAIYSAAFGSDDLAEAIVQTIDQPLLILRADLRIEEANAAFCALFRADAGEVQGSYLYDLGNGQWDIAELRTLLEQVLPQHSVISSYRVEHNFPRIGKRVMLLNARLIQDTAHRPDLVLLTISDHTEAEQARF